MQIDTGKFYNALADGRVLDDKGKEIPKENRISFEKGEVIEIKGQPFVVAYVDVVLHQLVLKSQKRFDIAKGK